MSGGGDEEGCPSSDEDRAAPSSLSPPTHSLLATSPSRLGGRSIVSEPAMPPSAPTPPSPSDEVERFSDDDDDDEWLPPPPPRPATAAAALPIPQGGPRRRKHVSCEGVRPLSLSLLVSPARHSASSADLLNLVLPLLSRPLAPASETASEDAQCRQRKVKCSREQQCSNCRLRGSVRPALVPLSLSLPRPLAALVVSER